MISDPPSVTPPLSASSDSSPTWSRLGEDHRDVNHVFDDERASSPLHSRGSDDRRITEVLSIPELSELEDNLRARILARPLTALAVGAGAGAAVAILRPLLGRAPAALIAAVAMRAGRRLVWQVAERSIHKLLTPDELDHAPSQAP